MELERLLRPFDRDVPGLPSRLAILGMPTPASPPDATSLLLQKRYEATTESWDVPCPAVALPMVLRSQLAISGTVAPPQHVLDLLTANLIANGAGYAVPRPPARGWPALIAPEMMAGLKLNLNQPLGLWANASLGTSALEQRIRAVRLGPDGDADPFGEFLPAVVVRNGVVRDGVVQRRPELADRRGEQPPVQPAHPNKHQRL